VNTLSVVTVIGDIDGPVERKVVKEKKLAEFKVSGIALRISAWEGRADQVPDAGRIVLQGYLLTRTYQYEGKERQSTDIRVTNVQPLDSGVDTDNPF
jgi:hypothetical protein